MDVMESIYGRRSVRNFKEEAPSDEAVREIVKVGTYAANGGNAQGLRFVVVSGRERLERYSTIAKTIFVAGMRQQLETAPLDKKEWIQRAMRNLSDPATNIFHSAPLAIFVFASPRCITPVEDASLAAGNMMLAAWSMGIGSCWIGFATSLQHSPEFMSEVDVPKGDRLIAPLVMGFPSKPTGQGHRNEPQFKWVR